jgi:hypothetical protein
MNEKYTPELIKSIAEHIGCGLVCFLNPETIEVIKIPQGFLEENEFSEDDFYQADLARIEHEWGNSIRIEPPESFESFKDMEWFARNEIQDKPMQMKLLNALSHGKPFRNFKNIVESSEFRQQWFDYHQQCLEKYVRDQLSAGEWIEYPEEEDEEL